MLTLARMILSVGRREIASFMSCNEEILVRGIVARAAPLWERKFRSSDHSAPSTLKPVRLRLERWQNILGNANLLDRRLLYSGISAASLEEVLGEVETLAQGALPAWATTLGSIISSKALTCNADGRADQSVLTGNAARLLPFQDLFAGIIHYASDRAKAQSGSAWDVLRPLAMAALEKQLLAHLTFVSNLAIGRNFYEFRFERAPASALEFAWQQQETSTEIYSAFVRYMRQGGLVKLLEEYPVLARLICQSVEQWINNSVNFCRRFQLDFFDLRAFFGWEIAESGGAIDRIRTDLSDRHHGGQTVIECILHTGERVIYKPRTVQPEIAFYHFISWLNMRGLSCNLKLLRAVDKATHGWVESVAWAACQTHAEVKRFYIRAGMLLGALYVLGVTDIHCENLIASGEHPIIVDLETLLSCNWQGSKQFSADGSAEQSLDSESSILSTGLLPRWQTSADGQQFDLSALGSDETQDPDIHVQSWHAINTDQMMLAGSETLDSTLAHRVRLDNKLPPVSDHLPMFLDGFKQVYDCLLENRRQLMSNDSLLTIFDHLNLRILVRNTTTYTRLHLHLLHPEFLKNGIERSIELEWLARPISGTLTPSEDRKLLYEYERTAMENLDIPRFSTYTWNDTGHTPDDTDLSFLFRVRDSQMIRRKLADLSPLDCNKQVEIIENAVRSRFLAG